jgi:hypothetical protein
MSEAHSRTVTPMSMMIDVFVYLERLQQSLEKLRDELVNEPDVQHIELSDARSHCRKIDEELRAIKSLLSLKKHGDDLVGPVWPDPPKGPPNFKLVS